MKRTLPVCALIALTALPARATIYVVNFTGTVDQTQGATGDSIGDTVTGHFDLDSVTGGFFDFTVAGRSVAPSFLSSASIVPALTDAIYTAQVSAVSQGVPTNSSFTLDLSSLSFWPSSDTAYTLLTDTTQLTSNLDTIDNPLTAFPSTFGYYTANSDGTNIVALDADLTSLTVVTAPEPGSLALLASSILGVLVSVRRARAV